MSNRIARQLLTATATPILKKRKQMVEARLLSNITKSYIIGYMEELKQLTETL